MQNKVNSVKWIYFKVFLKERNIHALCCTSYSYNNVFCRYWYYKTQPYTIIILSLTLEKKTSEHHIPTIPVDGAAVLVTSQTTENVWCTLDKCCNQNFLTDAFTVDHLLSKISSSSTREFAWMSPIDGIDLPFFKNYLKKL